MPTYYSDGYHSHKYRVNTVTSSLNFRGTYVSLGHAVAQLVEALRCKPEGRGFDSRWNYSLTSSFRPHYGPGFDSASDRNEYHEYFLEGNGGRCVGLTTLLPSYEDCPEIWENKPPGTLKVCTGL